MKNFILQIKEVTTLRGFLINLLILLTLGLCFVWPMPNNQLPFHRNGFIYPVVLIAIGIFWSSSQAKMKIDFSKIKFVLIVICALTLFMLVNGLIVAPDIQKMITTWNGQWLRPVLLFCAGLVIVPTIQSQLPTFSAAKFFTLVIVFFWGVICLHLLDTLWLFWRDGVIHWGETRIVYNRTRMSFQINMVTGFIIAELLARSLINKRFLQLNTPILILIFFSNLLCTGFVDTRWGTIGLIGNLFSTFILLIFHSTRRSRLMSSCLILVSIIAASALLGYTSWKKDSRWQNLKSDAIAGWSVPITSFCYINNQKAKPLNGNGDPINHSNGCRASFFHNGWKLVWEHPAGIGPRKEAFNYVLRRDTQNKHITIPHSHYGLIEFGIQNGIIGIIGWLVLLVSCWHIGWREFRNGNSMVGMFLLLFTVGFFSRTLVDHNLLDHFLEQYMMLTGLLIGMCALQHQPLNSKSLCPE